MKKSTIFFALFALFLSQIIFSCNPDKTEMPIPALSQSEILVSTLKFSGDMAAEVQVFDKFLKAASKEVGKVKALDFAAQNYQLYLKKNGIEINTSKQNLRVSSGFQELIEKMQGELITLNEGDKNVAIQIIEKFNNLVQNGNYSNEEKETFKMLLKDFNTAYDFTLTVLGDNNGKIGICWKKIWCVLAYGAGTGLVNGVGGLVLCGPICAAGGFVGGFVVGIYGGVTAYCPNCN